MCLFFGSLGGHFKSKNADIVLKSLSVKVKKSKSNGINKKRCSVNYEFSSKSFLFIALETIWLNSTNVALRAKNLYAIKVIYLTTSQRCSVQVQFYCVA